MCVETHNCASLRVGAKEINGAFYYVWFMTTQTMGKLERVTVRERGEYRRGELNSPALNSRASNSA
jgi:hypothetical protein